jgi:alpha-galactosidase
VKKIVFIGAGSTVFFKTVLVDILHYEALQTFQVVLFDIDVTRVRDSEKLGHRIFSAKNLDNSVLVASSLEEALTGADYVLCMFQIGGVESTRIDFDIPEKFGLRQTIGDTLGIGGIMRALRTVPQLLRLTQAMEQYCPDALLINYANPMAINCWALSELSEINSVGLCHSIPHTLGELCSDLGVDRNRVVFSVAGINHLAFFLTLKLDGEDLYPKLRDVYQRQGFPDDNKVRYDLFDKFGYFVTESSEHLSEYVPWYIKAGREDLLECFNIPLDEYLGRCEIQQRVWTAIRDCIDGESGYQSDYDHEALASQVQDIVIMPRMRAGALNVYKELDCMNQSVDYGARIINALETNQPTVVYGNVINGGVISNLPQDACVEVPCLVDAHGIQSLQVGSIPTQLAGLIQTNITVQKLVVEALRHERRDHVYHAALLDPHTAAELSTDEIVRMVDELLAAHRPSLPDWLW